MSYRYRNDRSTQANINVFDKVLPKLGKIICIRGYRYKGRYDALHEAVVVRGENGYARFGGLLWGYSGEGPRGLRQLLLKLGVNPDMADNLPFQTKRLNKIGEDWRINCTK